MINEFDYVFGEFSGEELSLEEASELMEKHKLPFIRVSKGGGLVSNSSLKEYYDRRMYMNKMISIGLDWEKWQRENPKKWTFDEEVGGE